MKYRSGFVTNSSSSSYIVSLPSEMRLYEWVGVLSQIPLRKEGWYSDGHTFKEPITDPDWYRDEYGCDCEEDNKSCKKIEEALKAGHKVFHINISYYNDSGNVSAEFSRFKKANPELILSDLS